MQNALPHQKDVPTAVYHGAVRPLVADGATILGVPRLRLRRNAPFS